MLAFFTAERGHKLIQDMVPGFGRGFFVVRGLDLEDRAGFSPSPQGCSRKGATNGLKSIRLALILECSAPNRMAWAKALAEARKKSINGNGAFDPGWSSRNFEKKE